MKPSSACSASWPPSRSRRENRQAKGTAQRQRPRDGYVNGGRHQTRFDSACRLACRSGAACSANWEGRQAWRGGDGRRADPLEGKQSAQASAMEAERARRHRRLDAQHDSATRHCRGTHECLQCWCTSPRTRRTVFTHLRETTKPQIRRSGSVPKHGYGCTVPRDSVLRQSAIQCMK